MNGNDEVQLPSIGIVLVALMMICAVPAASAAPKRVKRVVPWDIRSLSKTPKVHPAEMRPARGMRSLFYEGAEYRR